MRSLERNFLVKFTLLFCCVWMYVIFFISKKYSLLLNKVLEDKYGNIIIVETVKTVILRNDNVTDTKGLSKITGLKPEKQLQWTVVYNISAEGHNGKGVNVEVRHLSVIERQKYDDGWKKNAFNQYASDLIPVSRYAGDHRHTLCREYKYNKPLPDASVVIIFHNEAWSVLCRTVYSVLNTSPAHLLKEIYLVDDASTQEHLHERLEDEISKFSNVHLLRTGVRSGLIKARLLGFSKVTTKVAIFLDSHCECTEGWLEPLLERIAINETTVAVPLADHISPETFEFRSVNIENMYRGGFDFDLNFNWRPIPEDELKRRRAVIDPVRTPTFLGCCFAISVDYFKRLGTYDPGYQIWGSENLELSFKTWMCGGSLEIIPCSHVGHMFRNAMPYSWGDNGMQKLIKNSLRLAEVWMDEYKKLYYDRIFYNINFDIGDITDRKILRKSLKCHSFDWYLKNVYPGLFLPYNSQATGHIRNGGSGLCIESPVMSFMMYREVSLKMCSDYAFNQHWTLTEDSTIRRDEGCLGFQRPSSLVVMPCLPVIKEITWTYSQDNLIINHYNNHCLEVPLDRTNVQVKPCDSRDTQVWSWPRRVLQRPSKTRE